jgi:hypothetical protein
LFQKFIHVLYLFLFNNHQGLACLYAIILSNSKPVLSNGPVPAVLHARANSNHPKKFFSGVNSSDRSTFERKPKNFGQVNSVMPDQKDPADYTQRGPWTDRKESKLRGRNVPGGSNVLG